MKEAVWGYWLIILGIFIIVVLLLVQSFTSTNTQDYYLVKAITEASMEDSIDWSYYRQYGEIKINKEKFYESFLRRFAEEASVSTTYTIEFADIYEAPPKVGVKVSSKSSSFTLSGDADTFDIVNKIDAILESKTSSEVESAQGDYVTSAATARETFDEWFIEETSIVKPDPLTAEFSGHVCFGSGESTIEVEACGIPNDAGIDDRGYTANKIYCVFHVVGNDTCVQIIAYDDIEGIRQYGVAGS